VFDVLQFRFTEDFPVALTGSRVKKLDAAKGHTNRTVSCLLVDFEINEPIPGLFLGQLLRCFLIKVGQLPRGSEVSVDGPLRQSSQHQMFMHRLIGVSIEPV